MGEALKAKTNQFAVNEERIDRHDRIDTAVAGKRHAVRGSNGIARIGADKMALGAFARHL